MEAISAGNPAVHLDEEAPPATEFVQGSSLAMQELEAALPRLASGSFPVLLAGEDGVGKRTLARRLHALSAHASEPLVGLVCSTLRSNGSSTGLDADIFPAAGTVLLEEITELSILQQARMAELLLQAEREGALRFLATSKKSLEQEVRAGRLREDFLYRLGPVVLRVPPLRQRKQDIPALVSFFLAKYASQFHRPTPVLSSTTRAALLEYNWPGNVRELESTVGALVATGEEQVALAALRWNASRRQPKMPADGTSLKEASREASRNAERDLIMKVLSRTRWNRKRAAEELKISYKALLYKLKQIGLDEHTAL